MEYPIWILLVPAGIILTMYLVNDQIMKRRIRRWSEEDRRQTAEWGAAANRKL